MTAVAMARRRTGRDILDVGLKSRVLDVAILPAAQRTAPAGAALSSRQVPIQAHVSVPHPPSRFRTRFMRLVCRAVSRLTLATKA